MARLKKLPKVLRSYDQNESYRKQQQAVKALEIIAHGITGKFEHPTYDKSDLPYEMRLTFDEIQNQMNALTIQIDRLRSAQYHKRIDQRIAEEAEKAANRKSEIAKIYETRNQHIDESEVKKPGKTRKSKSHSKTTMQIEAEISKSFVERMKAKGFNIPEAN